MQSHCAYSTHTTKTHTDTHKEGIKQIDAHAKELSVDYLKDSQVCVVVVEWTPFTYPIDHSPITPSAVLLSRQEIILVNGSWAHTQWSVPSSHYPVINSQGFRGFVACDLKPVAH